MPRTKRPPEVSCTVAATLASAAGWRVKAFVTPVANRSRSVTVGASATATKGSPMRFCESVNVMPSHPRRSARSAWAVTVPISGIRIVHNPMADTIRRSGRFLNAAGRAQLTRERDEQLLGQIRELAQHRPEQLDGDHRDLHIGHG